jgi:hypothetical protein
VSYKLKRLCQSINLLLAYIYSVVSSFIVSVLGTSVSEFGELLFIVLVLQLSITSLLS